MTGLEVIPRDDGPIHPGPLDRSPDGDPGAVPTDGAAVLRSIGLEGLIRWLETTSYGVCITGENHTWVYLNPAAERIVGGRLQDLYGRDYLLHFPEHERAALLALEGNQRAGDTDFYTNTVLRPDGSEIQMTWSGSVITVDGVELAPAIFHETTQVRQAQRDAVELAAKLHASTLTVDAGARVQTFEDLVAEAVEDTRACAAGLFLSDTDTGGLRLAASEQMQDHGAATVHAAAVTLTDLPGAEDLLRGRSIFLSDAVSRYHADPHTTRWPTEVFGAESAGAAQFPVWRGGRVDGVLVVLFPADVTSPSETDLALLSSLADQASIVLGADLVRRTVSRASASTERERIARDLHDSVSQGLFSLHARAQVVRRGLRAGNLQLALEAAEDLELLARQATTEMRALLDELRSEQQDAVASSDQVTVELGDHLQRLADDVTRREGLATEVTLSPAALPALPAATSDHLLRIVGEAVHNVVKHADAEQVVIAVTADGPDLVVEVHDDGRGFTPGTTTGGLGQDTMRQRAALCGGRSTVTSAPGSGTTVRVTVPLRGTTQLPG